MNIFSYFFYLFPVHFAIAASAGVQIQPSLVRDTAGFIGGLLCTIKVD